MRPIDLIIIYLVVGAPFAARRVAQGAEEVSFRSYKLALRSYMISLKEGLLWPWSLAQCFSSRLTQRRITSATIGLNKIPGSPVEHSLNLCLAALNDLASIDRHPAFGQSTGLESMYRDARDTLEKYAGLSSALAISSADNTPAPHELELARVSGLGGDELLIAGLCNHRRNQSRLKLHQQSSRSELLGILNVWLDDYKMSGMETVQSVPVSRKEFLTNFCLRIAELARACEDFDTQRLVFEKLSEKTAELPVNERELKESLALGGGLICSSQEITSQSVKI
jgi:hypothetical protein